MSQNVSNPMMLSLLDDFHYYVYHSPLVLIAAD